MMLSVEALTIDVARPGQGAVRAADGVSFRLGAGETLGIVGPSGSGKSMLALGIIGLLPGTARASGTILFEGQDLLALPDAALCGIRGRRIGFVFQEPMTALNPAMTAGDQVAEGLRLDGLDRRAARAEALRMLDGVRITEAPSRFKAYPHELSGGQRQRVGLAMALCRKPALLIADEPTSALDAVVGLEILDLLDEAARATGMGLMLISHDMGVIARMAERVMVMAAGRVVEQGPTDAVLRRPASAVTRALMDALPARLRAGLPVSAPTGVTG